ncbi:KRF2 protein, partial [Falcunculus frontatus]|nr:KRF2 protein [Falcunculus frontatus]
MSCYTPCRPCQPCGPTPLANSCNEPCVRQCQDSTVAIQPSPVVVTLPVPLCHPLPCRSSPKAERLPGGVSGRGLLGSGFALAVNTGWH